MNRKKIISIIGCFVFTVFVSGGLKATEECFEGLSRSVFKFNMAIDEIVLEPLAKGYNKLIPKGLRDKYQREADIEKYLKNMDKLRQRGILS